MNSSSLAFFNVVISFITILTSFSMLILFFSHTRTHSFAVKKRPANLEGVSIHNLNVRGKRGNIVQVYPAVEYDYVPNGLEVNKGDYVHVQ